MGKSGEYKFVDNSRNYVVLFWIIVKWVSRLTLLGVAAFLVGASVYYSFIEGMFSDSVYYANNSSHKKAKNLELVFLVENLNHIKPPEFKGVYYNSDGHNYIKNYNLTGQKLEVGISSEGIDYQDKYGVIYTFDRNSFKFLSAFQQDSTGKYIDVTDSVDSDKAKEEMYEVVKPVLEWARNKKPNPNVQWIFDWYYHDRFN